jgi:ubiquinone biosynthesis protein Coq4
LDISLYYNEIYKRAESTSKEGKFQLKDLWKSPIFLLATIDEVHKDQEDLQQSLEELGNDPSNVKLLHSLPNDTSLKMQFLAKYLLRNMYYGSKQPQAPTLEIDIVIL